MIEKLEQYEWIAFDLYGVLDTYPDILIPLLDELNERGEMVYITGGACRDIIQSTLDNLGYKKFQHYATILSTVDYLTLEYGDDIWTYDENDDPYTDSELWDSAEANMCENLSIDVFIGSDDEHGVHFNGVTKFINISELIHKD